jgi:hypothetical protein
MTDGDRILDELVTGEPQPAIAHEGGARPPRIRYRHEALIDYMIAHPWLDQNQLAMHFGYTASWISTIICSDAFQSALAARRDEIVDPQLKATMVEQFRGLVGRSMEVLRHKLDGPVDAIDSQLVLRTLEVSSRALGYGARPPESPRQGDLHVHLESLGDNLVVLLRKTKAEQSPIDGEVVNDQKIAS